MPQPDPNVKGTTVFRIPALGGDRGLACAWIGRSAAPRPDPLELLPLVRSWPAPPPLVTVAQVHSSRWLRAVPGAAGSRTVAGEADALITSERGVALGIATADCLPIVVVDPEAPALGAVHAGWRGSLAGVLKETLEAMGSGLGAAPSRMTVAIGPAIGVCCYRVGEDVAARFAAAFGPSVVRTDSGAAPRLDLTEVNRRQAMAAGVPEANIEALGVCSRCEADSCHSYRRDGDRAGRMWLLAALI